GPISSKLAQRVARQHCVVAEVVDFVLAGHGGGDVRSAQDQVGGCAGGRRRGRRGDFKEGLSDAADVVEIHHLARGVVVVSTVAVDAVYKGIVDGGVGAPAVKETVEFAACVAVSADDLARIIDAANKGAVGPQGTVNGGVDAIAIEEAVECAAYEVIPNDLTRRVDSLCERAGGGKRIVEGGIKAVSQEKAVGAGGIFIVADDLT